MIKYKLRWDCYESGVGGLIGEYTTFKAAKEGFRLAIKRNKHLIYTLFPVNGAKKELFYDPNEY